MTPTKMPGTATGERADRQPWRGGVALSVKNQRFLPSSLYTREPWALPRQCGDRILRLKTRGGGRPVSAPTRGWEIERVCRRMGQIWEIVLRQSLSQKSKIFDSSLYTREAWGAAAPEGGFGCGGGWRGDYPSVSFADSSPHKGERAERCQWQEKRGERVAAVGR